MGCGDCNGFGSTHRMTLQKPRDNPSGDGHTDLTLGANWQDVSTRLWGKFKARGGREAQVFDQTEATVTHIIDFPYSSITRSIVPKWRLKMDSRVFNITSAFDVDEGRQTIRVHTTEVT